MTDNQFTETTRTSWFSRLGAAFRGVVAGFILFILSFLLLFWNEGRAVERYKTLKEGGGAVVSVQSGSVDPVNEGKLVHLTGTAETTESLADPDFAVSKTALRLERQVEWYQWKESARSSTKKKLGGSEETVTTYTYDKVWSDQLIRSADFKHPDGHQNPAAAQVEPREWMAEQVGVGAYRLPPSLVGSINNFSPLPLSQADPLPNAWPGKLHRSGDGLYIGSDPAVPQIGDARIKFRVANPTEVSIIARQVGDTLAPYVAKAGGSIELLRLGEHGAEDMIKMAQAENRMLAWILRLVGFVLMFAGLGMVLKPMAVLADVIPIMGKIVGVGTGLVAFLASSTLSMITIAIAWMFYRPVLAIALLAAAVVVIVTLKGKFKSKDKQA